MIRKDLLEFQYYLNRLSMFMKESYGIQEQTEIFYNQLLQVNEQYDLFFNNLIIFESSTPLSNFLDLIGMIFNCERKFSLFINGSYQQINLRDEDYLIYIKCQIIKQNFKGTYEEITKLYTTYSGGNEPIKGYVDLCFLYLTDNTNPLNCNIYFTNYDNFSSDIQTLFEYGYLTIESMGIIYNRILSNINNLSMFAPDTISDGAIYYKFAEEGITESGGKFV